MKTHLRILKSGDVIALCSTVLSKNFVWTFNFKKVTCIQCISSLGHKEKKWHEKNNEEYIKHLKNDLRRNKTLCFYK